MTQQKAQASSENEAEQDEEASSLRPAKRARVVTSEESVKALLASALGQKAERHQDE